MTGLPSERRVWRLVRYADGLPGPEHFALEAEPLAEPGPGQALVRTLHLGMDPFPRLRMSGPGGRAPPLPLGSVMIGRGVGRVVASREPSLPEGTYVAGELGWADHALVASADVKPVDPALGPVRASLGVLGPSGLAAWCSLTVLGRPKEGETVLVSAAAGSVGSVAAQLAKARGCRVLGVGGGPAQTAYLTGELKVDAALDFMADAPLAGQVRAAAPQGVDVFLDLVAGGMFDAAMANLAVGARAVLVGTLSDYNLAAGAADLGPRPNLAIILKRATVSGFLVADHAARFPEAMAELSGRLADGSLTVREHVVQGFERTPEAFAGLFGASFVGKQLVEVARDDG